MSYDYGLICSVAWRKKNLRKISTWQSRSMCDAVLWEFPNHRHLHVPEKSITRPWWFASKRLERYTNQNCFCPFLCATPVGYGKGESNTPFFSWAENRNILTTNIDSVVWWILNICAKNEYFESKNFIRISWRFSGERSVNNGSSAKYKEDAWRKKYWVLFRWSRQYHHNQ